MKKYSQFLKELPSKTVVFAFGRFNPPTTGHELLVKAVKKLAATNKADHAIYASKSQDAKKNPLPVDKKVHYLNLMFPNTHFVAANEQERTFIEAVKNLNKRYKNLIMVAGSDRVPEYEKILTKYNGKDFKYDTIQVISAGERDPDADDATGMSASKMRAVAAKGDYSQFKRGLPSTMREIDGRRLMNDVRQGMGLEMVKEQLNLVKDELREKYFRGEIFNIGDIVESAGVKYQIVKRGSNHLLLKEESGKLVSKWIQDVTLTEDVVPGYAPEEITFGGYTTKNLHHSADAAKAFQDTIARHGKDQPAAVLHALMATDTYMGLSDLHLNQGKVPTETEKDQWIKSHEHAKEHLDQLGEFLHHRDYWDNHKHEMEDMLSQYKEEGKVEMQDSHNKEGAMLPEELTDKTLKTNDKLKVARIIATMLGVDNAEASANPESLVNLALRKVRTKPLNPEALSILDKMLNLATEVGIKFDGTLKPTKLKEESPVVDKNSNRNMSRLKYADYVKLNAMNKGVAPGESMTHSGEDHTVRKMKVKHMTEEQLDEISQKLAGDYYAAATKKHIAKVGVKPNMYGRIEKDMGKQRKAGVDRALDRVTGARKTNEETILEGAYEKAEENKRSADAAKKQGDMFAHHLHMADHHDNMAEWHASKGRHGEADRHAEKSEQHHEKAMSLKEETALEEATDMATLRQKLNKHTELAIKANRAGNDEEVKKHQGHINKIKDKMAKLVRSEAVKEPTGDLKDACWKGYTAVGMKMKNGKKVPNCVPVNEETDEEDADDQVRNTVGVCPVCGKEDCECEKETMAKTKAMEPTFDPFFKENAVDVEDYEEKWEEHVFADEEPSDEEVDHFMNNISDDELLDLYDDEELSIVDDETGEELEADDDEEEKLKESALMEVLSRIERMKAKVRIRRTKAKRERKAKIALKRYSDSATINKRARRLAVKLMKKRLLRGRDPAKISVGEKERVERIVERRKKLLGRLAMRLAPRVRKVEKARMTHSKFTQPAPAIGM